MENDGGPAFPVDVWKNDALTEHKGMSFRDLAAIAAMQGLLASKQFEDDPVTIANEAMHIARALTGERVQRRLDDEQAG